MLWLVGQMAAILLLVSLLAVALGFWIRGWLLEDQHAFALNEWTRKLNDAQQAIKQFEEERNKLSKRIDELQSDYQAALNNEGRLYKQLETLERDRSFSISPPISTAQELIHASEKITQLEKVLQERDRVLTELRQQLELISGKPTQKLPAITKNEIRKIKPNFLLNEPPQQADNLRRIRGIGPKLAKQFSHIGIYTFQQLAKLEEEHVAWLADQMRVSPNRIQRDGWITQARALLDESSKEPTSIEQKESKTP